MDVIGAQFFISLLLAMSVSGQGDQEYTIQLTDANGDEYEGVVDVDISKGEEVFKTAYTLTEDGEVKLKGVNGPYSVRDTNKKIDAHVYEEYDMCFLERYDASTEVSAKNLKDSIESEIQTYGDTGKVIWEKMKVSDTPIEDVSAVSAVIASHCEDKNSYWAEVESEEVTCDGKECEEVGALCTEKCHTEKEKKCTKFLFLPLKCETKDIKKCCTCC